MSWSLQLLTTLTGNSNWQLGWDADD